MREDTIIKLKERYILFQENEHIGVYDTETKLLILRIKAGENMLTEAVRKEIERPQTIKWLSMRPYWRWLGYLVKNYEDLFEQPDLTAAKEAMEEADYFSVVNRKNFAENYRVTHEFGKRRLVLWGDTVINGMIQKELLEKIETVIVRRTCDVENGNSFAAFAERESIGEILPEEQRDCLQLSASDIVLCDLTGMNKGQVLQCNEYFTNRECVVLYYGNMAEKIIVGPLVVGGESACLNCLEQQGLLEKYYCGESGYLDRIFAHFMLAFILRTVYYIKGENLYYLLSDAQIPINKLFTVDRNDLTATMEYVFREVDCFCNQ